MNIFKRLISFFCLVRKKSVISTYFMGFEVFPIHIINGKYGKLLALFILNLGNMNFRYLCLH